jgi:diacylglycerol kinase family enzyme
LHANRPGSGLDYWRGKEITIETDPDRPVWTDGEYSGRTPLTATVLPGALAVVVP